MAGLRGLPAAGGDAHAHPRLVVRGRGHQARAAAPRRRPCSRSARTSSSWAGSRAGTRSGCTWSLGGSAREVGLASASPTYMAYYRTVKRRFLEAVAGASSHPVPAAATRLPGPRRALRRLPLVARLPRSAARGRRPLARRGHRRSDPHGAEGAGRPHAARPGRAAAAAHAEARAHQPGGPRARPGAGAAPGGGRGRGRTHRTSCLPPPTHRGRRPGHRRRASWRCRSPAPTTSSWTWKATRSPWTTASTTSSASWSSGSRDPDGQPTFHAFWSRDEDGRVTPAAEQRAFEQTIDLIIGAAGRGPQPPRVPLRHLRADRVRSAHGPLRAPGRWRSTA